MNPIGRCPSNVLAEPKERLANSTKPAPEGEIPVLLNLLSARVECLSEQLAELRSKLSPVLLPTQCEAKADQPDANTAVGGVLACQIARIDCMVYDVLSVTGALAL